MQKAIIHKNLLKLISFFSKLFHGHQKCSSRCQSSKPVISDSFCQLNTCLAGRQISGSPYSTIFCDILQGITFYILLLMICNFESITSLLQTAYSWIIFVNPFCQSLPFREFNPFTFKCTQQQERVSVILVLIPICLFCS